MHDLSGIGHDLFGDRLEIIVVDKIPVIYVIKGGFAFREMEMLIGQ